MAKTEKPDDTLQHDVRNLLSPAMIALDRLADHADPFVRTEAERGLQAIEAAVRRLRGKAS